MKERDLTGREKDWPEVLFIILTYSYFDSTLLLSSITCK